MGDLHRSWDGFRPFSCPMPHLITDPLNDRGQRGSIDKKKKIFIKILKKKNRPKNSQTPNCKSLAPYD